MCTWFLISGFRIFRLDFIHEKIRESFAFRRHLADFRFLAENSWVQLTVTMLLFSQLKIRRTITSKGEWLYVLTPFNLRHIMCYYMYKLVLMIMRKIDFQVLTNDHDLRSPEYVTTFFDMETVRLSVCVCVSIITQKRIDQSKPNFVKE